MQLRSKHFSGRFENSEGGAWIPKKETLDSQCGLFQEQGPLFEQRQSTRAVSVSIGWDGKPSASDPDKEGCRVLKCYREWASERFSSKRMSRRCKIGVVCRLRTKGPWPGNWTLPGRVGAGDERGPRGVCTKELIPIKE